MKVLEDINVNGSGNFDNELTATSLSLTTSLFLQGFELKPYSPDGGTPDRLMYDGYVLLDEYNYSEYLDSSYVKKSGDTMTGHLSFTQSDPKIFGNGSYITLQPNRTDGTQMLVFDGVYKSVRPAGNNLTNLGFSNTRWSNVYSVKGDFASSEAGIIKIKRTTTAGGAYIDYYPANQDTNYWRVGTTYNRNFVFSRDGLDTTQLQINTKDQLVSRVADGTAPFIVASKTLVSNLNAELFGGFKRRYYSATTGSITHLKIMSFTVKGVYTNTPISFKYFGRTSDAGTTSVGTVTMQMTTSRIGAVYVTGDSILAGRFSLYRTSFTETTNDEGTVTQREAKYELYVKIGTWGTLYVFDVQASSDVSNLVVSEKTYVEVTLPTTYDSLITSQLGAVYGTATRLSTPRTLWGQSFDGSGNVSGALSGVTSITGVSGTDFALKNNGSIQLRYNDNNASSVVLNRVQFKPFNAANGLLDLGATSARWKGIYGQTLDLTGTLGVTGVATFGNDILYNSDATLKIYDVDIDSDNYGNEAVALQTCFDNQDPETSDYVTPYEGRCNLLLQPRGGQVYVGYTPTSVQSPYSLNVHNKMKLYGSSSDNPEVLFYRDGVSSWKIMNSGGNLIFQNNYTTAVQGSYFDVLKINYNSGNATLKGSLTTGGNILPTAHNGGNIGATDKRWITGYFSSVVSVGGANSSSSSGTRNTYIGAGVIDLSYTNPYIDFHYNNSTTDYTSRIIESASGVLSVNNVKHQSGNVLPNSSGAGNVGTSYAKWLNGYINNLYTETVRANTIYLGSTAKLAYDSTLNALLLTRDDGTVVHFLASGNATVGGTLTVNGVGITGATTDGINQLTIDGEIHSDYLCWFDEIEVTTGIGSDKWSIYYGEASFTSIQSDNVLPKSNSSGSIGSSSLKWLNGYINNLYSDAISVETLIPRNSPYISVNAMSLDLYECELYGYDSDNLDVWNVDFAGNAWFLSVTQTSDVRYKNIKENVHLKLSDIAAAPTFKFAWANDTDGSTHIGTSAQYWQEIAGELVVANKKTGKLGLDYSTAALVSAISIARELESAKLEILELKDKISALEGRIV